TGAGFLRPIPPRRPAITHSVFPGHIRLYSRAMSETFQELKTRLAEIHDLSKAVGMLAWDMEVMMPSAGGPVRAQQLAAVSKVAHEKFTDASIGKLLDT